MNLLIFCIVFFTAVWVYLDSKAIKAGQGQGQNSPGLWFVATLLLWIIVFPYYLYKRRGIMRENESAGLKYNKALAAASLIVIAIAIGTTFMGKKAAPECNEAEVKTTVINIVREKMKERVNALSKYRGGNLATDADLNSIIISVENIRALNFNKDTGRKECAADLNVTIKGEKETFPIGYSSELIQDKKDQFYICNRIIAKSRCHNRNFIDPQGGIYAISLDNTIMIKRLQVIYPGQTLKIISDNTRYEPLEAETEEIKINGKVIWFGREIER